MKLIYLIILISSIMKLQAQDTTPTDQHFWHSETTSASSHRIWNIWTDVPNWKSWDTGLKDAQIDGKFQLNESGIMTTLEGRKTKFKVVEYEEGHFYTFRTKLPLGSLYVKRYLEKQENETLYTHEVWFKGLTKGIFAKAFGGKFRKMLPDVLNRIKTIAEQDDSH